MKLKKPLKIKPEIRIAMPLSKIITLPQPRTVFIGVEELADEIEKSGLINIPMIARMTHEEFERHLKIINIAHYRRFKPYNFNGKLFRRHYHLLICGEMRTRACRIMVEQKRRPQLLLEHFNGGPNILVLMREHISTTEIIEAQLSENKYNKPNIYDEASFIACNYRAMHLGEDGDLTYKKFGTKIGKDSDIVSRALLIEALPFKIKKILRQGYPIGIAHQIGRLYHAGEMDLMGWLVKAGGVNVKIKSVEEFAKVVSDFFKTKDIENKCNQQLLDIFQEYQDKDDRTAQYRHRIGAQYSLALCEAIEYFKRLNNLFESKLLGCESSPFSLQGPLLNTNKLIQIYEKWILHLLKIENTKHFKKLARLAGLPPLKNIQKLLQKFELLVIRQKKVYG